ncbi:hypothetical protein, partial [Streptomyces sp. SID3343]|uniref:DUF7134 domain-containing protein n=1 Tax=Streptomyces sp. SID3343 TaxID=2690260 RepID=UPI001F210DB3
MLAAPVGLIVVVLCFALHTLLYRAEESYTPLATMAAAIVAVLLALPVGPLRKRPLPVLAIMAAEAIAVLLLRDRAWPLVPALAVPVGRYAADASRRNGTVAAGLVWAAWGAVFVGRWAVDTGSDTLGDVLTQLAAGLVMVLIGWMMGTSARQRRDHLKALHTKAAARAVLAERLRIARELHNMVAHSVDVIAIRAGGRGEPAPGLAAGRRAHRARRDREHQSADPGRAAPDAGLAAPGSTGTPGPTAPGSRRWWAWRGSSGWSRPRRRRAYGWTWPGTAKGARCHPRSTRPRSGWIIQEPVTNTVRHSGTRRCRVSLEYLAEELAIEVIDDGDGGGTAGTTS